MILDQIVAATRERVERLKSKESLLHLERRLPDVPPRPFCAALRHPDRLGLIAEIKKASPSKGVIAPDFDHRAVAALYRDAQGRLPEHPDRAAILSGRFEASQRCPRHQRQAVPAERFHH